MPQARTPADQPAGTPAFRLRPAEVVELVKRIRDGVREKFGIEIHPEPNFIGFA